MLWVRETIPITVDLAISHFAFQFVAYSAPRGRFTQAILCIRSSSMSATAIKKTSSRSDGRAFSLVLAVAFLSAGLTGARAELIDRGGGLIFDTVLNITWLQDSQFAWTSGYQVPGRAADDPMFHGLMDFSEATTWAGQLSYFDNVRDQFITGWQLPPVLPINGGSTFFSQVGTSGASDDSYNISAPGTPYAGSTRNALAYLYFNTLGNTARCPPIGGFGACLDPYGPRGTPLNVGPFINMPVAGGMFFTNSNKDVAYAADAWAFDFAGTTYGAQSAVNATGYYGRRIAWAVHEGDVAMVPELPKAAQLGLGLLIGGIWVSRRLRRVQLHP